MKQAQTKICCIPYYRQDQYELLRKALIDKETFSIPYERSMAITESQHRKMEKKGFKVVKIDVDIEELIEWAISKNLTLNPESRIKFAMEKLKEIINEGDLL